MTSAQLNSCPLYISIFHPLFGSTQPLNSLCNVTPPGWSWAEKKSPHEPTMLLVAPWCKMEKITYTLEDERLVHLQPSPMKRKEVMIWTTNLQGRTCSSRSSSGVVTSFEPFPAHSSAFANFQSNNSPPTFPEKKLHQAASPWPESERRIHKAIEPEAPRRWGSHGILRPNAVLPRCRTPLQTGWSRGPWSREFGRAGNPPKTGGQRCHAWKSNLAKLVSRKAATMPMPPKSPGFVVVVVVFLFFFMCFSMFFVIQLYQI